jgi:hypothetical protein
MRNVNWGKVKGKALLMADLGKVCKVPGCCEPLTNLTGPGSSTYCITHQKNMACHGGTAKDGKLYTQHKERVCSVCGCSPWDDETAKKYGYYHFKEDDPDMFNRIARAMLVGDHSGTRRIDGNKEHKEDITTLCQNCNAVKTMSNQDYLSRKEVV